MGLLSMYLSLAVSSTWLWVAALTVTFFWLYMRFWVTFYDTSIIRTDEKVFIVTGAESGVGKMCVDLLAARGGKVIMACKDTNLGHTAREEIVTRTLNEKVEVRYLDLGSLASVRQFSKDIHKSQDRLDVLINYAGAACITDGTTSDGLNTTMQVNHFGPFLLTNLLLDMLKQSSPSRVVFVSSVSHHLHKFTLDNINCDKEPLSSCRIYYNSKLANILTSNYFARILQGTGVTVNSVHPGMSQPDLVSNSCSGSIMGMLYNMFLSVFGKTFREAAMTPVYAATEPSITHITGKHFAECKVSRCVANITQDKNLQEKLFDKSAQLVQLRPEEKHI